MVLGFLSRQDEDRLMPAIIDPVRLLSFGRLRRRTSLGDMPEDCSIGWYSVVHTHVLFLTVWFQRERSKALLSVAIMGLVLWSMVKSDAENDMETEFLMTTSGGSSLRGDEELAW
jgi:hypothetical protein